MLKKFIQNTFDIRNRELPVSLFMQLYIFLIITTLLIVKPTVNALFLSELTSKSLPYAYLMVALVAAVSSFFYNKALGYFSLKKVISFTLVFSAAVFLSLYLLLNLQYFNTGILYFYYVWVALFALLATSQFWVLANYVYNIRQAKRLFGFIGAGGILGGIAGGYLTNLLAPVIGTANLMIIASILLLGCIPILHFIWKNRVNPSKNIDDASSTPTATTPAFKLILKYRHLSYIAGIIGMGVVVAKLVDYQFSDMASQYYPNSNNLASFFGFWFSTFNLVSLLLQLFLTRKIVGVWGVASTLLILPLSIGLAAMLFLVFPELWVVILIKGLDGSLKQSVNKAASELLVLPVSEEIKNKTKSFIDVVVDSLATGLAGALLIFVIQTFNFSAREVSVLIIILLAAWLFFIYKVRGTYFESFRENLMHFTQTHNLHNKNKSSKRVLTKKTIIGVLENGNTSELLFILKRLDKIQDKRIRDLVIGLLSHPSEKVKTAAIKSLYFLDKGAAVKKVQQLIHFKEDEVVLAAMEYLLAHTNLNELRIFDAYLNHKDEYISGAALLCLAKEAQENEVLAKRYNLKLRLDMQIKELSLPEEMHRDATTIQLLLSIGYAGYLRYFSFISAHFNNKNPEVVKAAIKAAGISAHPMFFKELLNFVKQAEFRSYAIDAITNYRASVIALLVNAVNKPEGSFTVKENIPEILADLNSPKATTALIKLLKNKNLTIRLKAAKALYQLKEKNPKLKFQKRKIVRLILTECNLYYQALSAMYLQKKITKSLDAKNLEDKETEELTARNSLIEILEEHLEYALEQIFTLLGMRYPQKDIEIAYKGIKSEQEEVRANALEFLDNLLQKDLRQTLLPLVEHVNIGQLEPLQKATPTEYECFKNLLSGQDLQVKLAVLNLIQQTQAKEFKPLLKGLDKHSNKKIRRFARKAKLAIK